MLPCKADICLIIVLRWISRWQNTHRGASEVLVGKSACGAIGQCKFDPWKLWFRERTDSWKLFSLTSCAHKCTPRWNLKKEHGVCYEGNYSPNRAARFRGSIRPHWSFSFGTFSLRNKTGKWTANYLTPPKISIKPRNRALVDWFHSSFSFLDTIITPPVFFLYFWNKCSVVVVVVVVVSMKLEVIVWGWGNLKGTGSLRQKNSQTQETALGTGF